MSPERQVQEKRRYRHAQLRYEREPWMIDLQAMSSFGGRDPRHLSVPTEYSRLERKPRDRRHYCCLKTTGFYQLT